MLILILLSGQVNVLALHTCVSSFSAKFNRSFRHSYIRNSETFVFRIQIQLTISYSIEQNFGAELLPRLEKLYVILIAKFMSTIMAQFCNRRMAHLSSLYEENMSVFPLHFSCRFRYHISQFRVVLTRILVYLCGEFSRQWSSEDILCVMDGPT
jgi:hypothetical protein